MILTLIAFTLCPATGVRISCVHDGDTLHWRGEKMRLENVNTPELDGKCEYERKLAIRARDRLLVLLNSGRVTYTSYGYDRMQKPRLLVRISVNGVDVGSTLIREGLARVWDGKRHPWC